MAEHADIWNGFGPVERFARKNRALDRWCEEVGRDARRIERSVLLTEPGDADRVEEFVEAGAQHVILPAGAPFDLTDVERILLTAKRGG